MKTVLYILIGLIAWPSLADRPEPEQEVIEYGIRPLKFDDIELEALRQRLDSLESMQRKQSNIFVHELPRGIALVLRVEFWNRGVLDRVMSSEIRDVGHPGEAVHRGKHNFSLQNKVGPHPLGTPSWYVMVSDQVGYGFPLSDVKPWTGASLRSRGWSLEELLADERVVYRYAPRDESWTFVVYAQAEPVVEGDRPGAWPVTGARDRDKPYELPLHRRVEADDDLPGVSDEGGSGARQPAEPG